MAVIPGNAKLNPQRVREIRMLYAEGWTQPAIARKFGVGPKTIGSIVRGESWKEVTGGEPIVTDTEAQMRLLRGGGELLTAQTPIEEQPLHQATIERLAKLSAEIAAQEAAAKAQSPMQSHKAALPPAIAERVAAYLDPNGPGPEELVKSITPEMRQRAEDYRKLMVQRQLEADALEAQVRERERERSTAETSQPALNAEKLLETLKDENQP